MESELYGIGSIARQCGLTVSAPLPRLFSDLGHLLPTTATVPVIYDAAT